MFSRCDPPRNLGLFCRFLRVAVIVPSLQLSPRPPCCSRVSLNTFPLRHSELISSPAVQITSLILGTAIFSPGLNSESLRGRGLTSLEAEETESKSEPSFLETGWSGGTMDLYLTGCKNSRTILHILSLDSPHILVRSEYKDAGRAALSVNADCIDVFLVTGQSGIDPPLAGGEYLLDHTCQSTSGVTGGFWMGSGFTSLHSATPSQFRPALSAASLGRFKRSYSQHPPRYTETFLSLLRMNCTSILSPTLRENTLCTSVGT